VDTRTGMDVLISKKIHITAIIESLSSGSVSQFTELLYEV